MPDTGTHLCVCESECVCALECVTCHENVWPSLQRSNQSTARDTRGYGENAPLYNTHSTVYIHWFWRLRIILICAVCLCFVFSQIDSRLVWSSRVVAWPSRFAATTTVSSPTAWTRACWTMAASWTLSTWFPMSSCSSSPSPSSSLVGIWKSTHICYIYAQWKKYKLSNLAQTSTWTQGWPDLDFGGQKGQRHGCKLQLDWLAEADTTRR